MRKIYCLIILSFLILAPAFAISQTDGSVEMADGLRSSGKIYVVVAVIVTLFTGLVIYIVTLDRKLSKLEKESKESQR